MPEYIRRSLIRIPMSKSVLNGELLNTAADAVILDVAQGLSNDRLSFDRVEMAAIVRAIALSGAELFVRINADTVAADLESVVFPGLTGLVIPGLETAAEIIDIDAVIEEMEGYRGIPSGTLQIDAEITTPLGVWNSLEIARASGRMAALTVGETALYCTLGLEPMLTLDVDPLDIIKFQLITNATAAGIQAQGMSYPLSISLGDPDPATLAKSVRLARDIGFKGAVCPSPSWIAACNAGFGPSPLEMAYYRKVREVFADGLKKGLASVPLEGRMIDTPVDLRARVFLEWGDRVAAREAEKAEAAGPKSTL
jgi:citrate lyase subunit beta/citryl-CoA lyase